MTAKPTTTANTPRLELINLQLLIPSPYNPRTKFDETKLAELSLSIREHGILEPILVRPLPITGKRFQEYEIVAGERRYRAALMALSTRDSVPCLIRDLDDTEARLIAVTENKQRSDLDALDEARGYQILKDGGLTQAEIAEKLGISAGEVSKSLALLDMSEEVQGLMRGGKLGVGQARIIQSKLGAWPLMALAFAQYVIQEACSVRYVEDCFKANQKLPWKFLTELPQTAGRHISYDTPFKNECATCPHGAFLKDSALCMMPAEFDRKMAEHREAKTLAEEVSRQKLLARMKPTLGGEGTKAKALPLLADLKWSEYERLFTPPAGCSEECACRGRAIDHSGKEVPICLDKGRYQKLQAAATKAKNKAIKTAAQAKKAKVIALTSGKIGELDRAVIGRAYALTVRQMLGGLYTEGRREAIKMLPTASELDIVRTGHFRRIRAAFDHGGTGGSWQDVMEGLAEAMGAISPAERLQVLLAASGAVAINALNEQVKEPGYKHAEQAGWLLGEHVVGWCKPVEESK